MKRIILLIAFISVSIISNAQDEKLDFIISQFCNDLNPEKIKKMSTTDAQTKLFQIGIDAREKCLNEVNEIDAKLRKENPNLSEQEIYILYNKKMIFRALDICPDFKEIALISLGECPKENKTLKKVFTAVEKVIADNKDKDYVELNKIITSTVFETMSQVEKDYKDGLANPQLVSDMNNYLFHKSDDFLKIVLALQLDNLKQTK